MLHCKTRPRGFFNGGYTRDNMFGLAMDYKAFVHQLAEEILVKTDAHLLLIPHTFAPAGHVESDNEASQHVLESLAPRFSGRAHLVSRKYDQSEIKSIIGMCDFFKGRVFRVNESTHQRINGFHETVYSV
jgi:colanic acid/amylovoran biosynthesis protein